MSKQISIKELNKYLVCSICDGYYRDAFTICDCLHTFCRQCLFDAFNANPKTNKWCPECNTSLSTKPKIVYDRNLQSCVDKLFPEFLKKEQKEQEVDTQNEAKRKLAAKEVTSEEPAQKKRVLSNREAPSSSSGSGSSSNTNTGTKTFPDVIVTLNIIPSTEKSINAQNTPDITLLVPMNTTTAELRKFIHRKYKKESHKLYDNRLLDKLIYYCGGTQLENETTLTKVAFANGYAGEEDKTNRATINGNWMTLALHGRW